MKTSKVTTPKPNLTRVFLIAGFILLVPLVAMQFNSEINWDFTDFFIMGILLMTIGLFYELGIKKIIDPVQRYVFIFGLFFAVLWLWAELAVGIFTNWGS